MGLIGLVRLHTLRMGCSCWRLPGQPLKQVIRIAFLQPNVKLFDIGPSIKGISVIHVTTSKISE